MTPDDQHRTPIGRPLPHGTHTFHGPVDIRRTEGNIQVITFTGAEESDLLHAAGNWMDEHLDALLISINWYGDFLSPYQEVDDIPGPPRHRLDLTVDVTGERQ